MESLYNAKIIKYKNGYQIQLFDEPITPLRYEFEDTFEHNYIDRENGDYEEDTFKMLRDAQRILNKQARQEEIDSMTEEEREEYFEECRQHSLYTSLGRTINSAYAIARSNDWDWFITLTFNPEKVDSFNYEEVTEKLSKWLNNQRRSSPNLKYIVVPERHKSGRWHFHGLFANYDGKMDDSGKRDKGQVIYNLGHYSLGWSTSTKIVSNDRVTKYIMKYITKDVLEKTKGKKRYWCSRNLEHEQIEKFIFTDKQKEQLLKAVEKHVVFVSECATPTNHIQYIELSCDDMKILRGNKRNVNQRNVNIDEIRYFFACSCESKIK